MRLIDVSTRKYQGTFALVDDIDFEELAAFKWYAMWADGLYVNRNLPSGSRPCSIRMHQQIMGVRGVIIDHVDGNTLNNQRSNLRVCSPQENAYNTRARLTPGRTSRFKGVSWHTASGRWIAQIAPAGGKHHLGCFDTEREAALAYDDAARRLFGAFARLNFTQIESARILRRQ